MTRRLGCVPLLALMVLQVPPASGAERATLISNVRFDELVGWCEDADAAKRSACSSYVSAYSTGAPWWTSKSGGGFCATPTVPISRRSSIQSSRG